jgi:hypothetical protein
MRGRHDDRDPSGDVLQDGGQDGVALLVGEHKLLREVRKDAQSLRAGIDHAIDGTLLAFEIEAAVGIEHGRNDREDASIGSDSGSGHATPSCLSRSSGVRSR